MTETERKFWEDFEEVLEIEQNPPQISYASDYPEPAKDRWIPSAEFNYQLINTNHNE